jgi:2-haloacid dehalogenase
MYKKIKIPKFKYILFDADGTLFDYDMAEGVALRKTFEQYSLNYNDDIRNIYREINSSMWKEFENGKIDKASLQTGRFERLLNECNYKADANEFNLIYLDFLAENGHLIDGALEICKELSEFCTLAIATNGIARTQKGR